MTEALLLILASVTACGIAARPPALDLGGRAAGT